MGPIEVCKIFDLVLPKAEIIFPKKTIETVSPADLVQGIIDIRKRLLCVQQIPHLMWKSSLFTEATLKNNSARFANAKIKDSPKNRYGVWLFDCMAPDEESGGNIVGFYTDIMTDSVSTNLLIAWIIQYENTKKHKIPLALRIFGYISMDEEWGSAYCIGAAIDFLEQHVRLEQQRFPRAERRRIIKDKKQAPEIYTVVLRAPTNHALYGSRSVEWKCQWMVEGHFRRYRNGKETFIKAYKKGPKDKPLKPKSRPLYLVQR